MSQPAQFEIEKEYDARYEGFDYDDVDEASRAPRPSRRDAEEEAFEEAWAAAAAEDSPGAKDDPFAALERAEQEYEQDQARKKPGKRLLERLEGEEGRRVKPSTGSGGVGAAALLTSQKRIAAALAANERLKDVISNPEAAAAALTVAAAPPGASKTAGLGRLAACLRSASAAASIADLDKLTAPKVFKDAFLSLKKLKGTLEKALVAAEGAVAQEEEAVRLLLTLATVPVTATALAECGQAGKRVRKLKKESSSAAVSGAAAVVVAAWKAAIMGPDSANKDKE